jgi:UDP-N-acetyl-D-mannosaminuronic acid dehydrogenase
MGYVGIPCAALLADVDGFRVTGVQRRSVRSGWKIDVLNAGQCPFEGDEPGLAELIHRVAVEKKTFQVTDDYAVCREAQAVLIDVQTPVDDDHVPRYASLREVCAQAGQHLQPGTLVIIESTVAPGTTQHVAQPILEESSGLQAGRDFHLAFSYERVMPGKLLAYITDMPRVVGGIDAESTRRAVELYGHIVRAEITASDCLTAEMAKVIENAYRDVNIAFANEVALACERMGVDVYDVRQLINARHDRHMHIPGAGVGGHCLPKDTYLLAYGVEAYGQGGAKRGDGGTGRGGDGEKGRQGDEVRNGFELVKMARQINDGMPAHMLGLVEEALSEAGQELAGARVAVLGVSYLEDADDTRNTPAVPLIVALQERGAEVVAHDPYVSEHEWRLAWPAEPGAPLTADLAAALAGADCAVLVTRHQTYCDLAASNPDGSGLAWLKAQLGRPVLVDGRNVFEREACEQAGLVYRGVGKGSASER